MRAIDADALIDDCKKYLNSLNPSRDGKECTRMHWLIGILSNAPTIEPDRRWIPCSKMEPKKSGHYLCTHGGTGIVSPDYYTTQEQAEELFADPEDEYLDLEEYIGWTSKNVIAWMPLPKAYREEGEK